MSDMYDWKWSYDRADQIIELVRSAMYADTEQNALGYEVPVAYLGNGLTTDLAELLVKWREQDGLVA